MERKVIVTIRGNHRGPDGKDNRIELITEGRLYKKGNAYCIEYDETVISGMEGTKTLIMVEDKRVSMERSGSHTSHFVFEKGKKYINSYYTPYGSLEMGIFSTQVESCVNEHNGKLDLKYQLDIAGRYTSSNELSVSYQENTGKRAINS